MKIATIDIGTNSIRLLRGILKDNQLMIGNKKIATTRIGAGIGNHTDDENIFLQTEAMDRTVNQLEVWANELSEWGADDISIIATSAVRDAVNKQEFIDLVKQKTSLNVEVVSGNKEAELGFLGVMLGINSDKPVMILDVGGGSTEIIIGTSRDGIIYSSSLNIGAVRMMSKYGNKGRLTSPLKNRMLRFIEEQIDKDRLMSLKYYKDKPSYLIGIGGTATSFGTVDLSLEPYDRAKIQSYCMDADRFMEIQHNLCEMSVDERKKIIGLEPQRADIIIAGGEIIASIIQKYKFSSMIISDYDNLEGLFADKYGNKFDKIYIVDDVELNN